MKNLPWQMALAAGLVASIAIGIELSRPLRATRAPVARNRGASIHRLETRRWSLARCWRARRSPTRPSPSIPQSGSRTRGRRPRPTSLNSPQFFHDRDSFAMDLVRTGRVNRIVRGRSPTSRCATYTRKIPPALVLGVMMTENDEFKSTARSNVGPWD
jgi:hypothetical protein